MANVVFSETKKPAKIGVVTVTYNSGKVIQEFMDSMVAQTHTEYVLYVIDNASNDDTLEQVSKFDGKLAIEVIANADNIGVAAGNNQGILAAKDNKCTHVLLINNDTVFEANLIEKLLNGMYELRCDMITPKIVHHDNQSLLWFAGGHFDKWIPYLNIHEGYQEQDSGKYDITRKITYAPTCCMLVNMPVFESVGLMDEKYFVYYDDSDFCMRALKAQMIMYYLPYIWFSHKVSSLTGGTGSDFLVRYTIRNKVYFIRKHMAIHLSFVFLCLTQVKYFLQMVLGIDKLERFLLKQRAFWEGFRL